MPAVKRKELYPPTPKEMTIEEVARIHAIDVEVLAEALKNQTSKDIRKLKEIRDAALTRHVSLTVTEAHKDILLMLRQIGATLVSELHYQSELAIEQPYRKNILPLDVRAEAYKKLVDSMKGLIPVERVVYGIDSKMGGSGDFSIVEYLDRIEG